MQRLLLVTLGAVAAGAVTGCGGTSTAVSLAIAQRVDIGATENAYAGAGGVTLDGGVVWATKPNEGEVLRIDARTGKILARLHGCDTANDVAAGPDAVYVACESTEEVVRLDPATGRVTGRADVGVKALGLAVTKDAIWVSNREFDDLVRVDPRTMRVVARIDAGRGAWDVAATSNAVWVTTQGLELAHIDPVTNDVVGRIPTAVDGVPITLYYVVADEESAWLTSPNGTLVRLDLGTDELTEAVQLGEEFAPGHVQIAGESVWVAGANDVALVDAASESVKAELKVADAPPLEHGGLRGIAPYEGGAWVANAADGEINEITVIDGE